jgi:hypothetical protein
MLFARAVPLRALFVIWFVATISNGAAANPLSQLIVKTPGFPEGARGS